MDFEKCINEAEQTIEIYNQVDRLMMSKDMDDVSMGMTLLSQGAKILPKALEDCKEPSNVTLNLSHAIITLENPVSLFISAGKNIFFNGKDIFKNTL